MWSNPSRLRFGITGVTRAWLRPWVTKRNPTMSVTRIIIFGGKPQNSPTQRSFSQCFFRKGTCPRIPSLSWWFDGSEIQRSLPRMMLKPCKPCKSCKSWEKTTNLNWSAGSLNHQQYNSIIIFLSPGLLKGDTKLCNLCGASIQRTETRWRCFHHCDFNVCEECFSAKRSAWKKGPYPPWN